MRMERYISPLWPALIALALTACTTGELAPDMDTDTLACAEAGASQCAGDVVVECVEEGGRVVARAEPCGLTDRVCHDGACVACRPGSSGCLAGNVARCRDDGSGWETQSECDLAAGLSCVAGVCADLCESARRDRSYHGCEFFPVDLDTYAPRSPPYGIIVSNPNHFATTVTLEVDDSAPGDAPAVRTLDEVEVAPFDLAVLSLPRRRVDGSQRGAEWDETHSAYTRRAYRIHSRHPVIAYQFNPLAGSSAFSNDASLLLPTSALGTRTTVVGWMQSHSTRGTVDEQSDTDLRAFLTVVGTTEATDVTVRFGPLVERVLGLEAGTSWGPGESATFTLGPFDTLNLETDAYRADFTGTVVESTQGVVIYTGAEAADAPVPGRVIDRRCCADHIEGQLLPDHALGGTFVLARTPAKARSINEALLDPALFVPESNEPEIVRVLAVRPGTTRVDTSLEAPYHAFTLEQGQSAFLTLDRDTQLRASQSVSVIQLMASQEVLGIPPGYPGGDPALLVVPPADQFRSDYVFLTPSTYAFDAVTITAPVDATVYLDGEPLPETCERAAVDPYPTPTEWVVYRCALSFPQIQGDLSVGPVGQGDGVHRVRADMPVGVVVSGFDEWVSYAYAAGMNVEVLE